MGRSFGFEADQDAGGGSRSAEPSVNVPVMMRSVGMPISVAASAD